MATIQEAVAEFGAFHVLVGRIDTEVIQQVLAHVGSIGVPTEILPESNLYPTQIGDMVRDLRAKHANGRVIVYTLSPLILNECQPAEASIVTRNTTGEVVVTRMDRTKSFKRRFAIFALGELWLTFCDGDKEAQLVPE